MTYSVDGEQYIAVVAGWGAVNALIGGPDLNGDGSMLMNLGTLVTITASSGLGDDEIDRMVQDYYRLRGWDEQGRPTPQKLADLGIIAPRHPAHSTPGG